MAAYILFFVSLVFISSAAFLTNENCDFEFGNPDWGLAEWIYDSASWFPQGQDKWHTFLPKDKGMISFICVNISRENKSMVEVQYSPIFHKLTLKLDRPAPNQFLYHVKAKAHDY